MSETLDTLADDRVAAFALVNNYIDAACYELNDLVTSYTKSNLEPVKKAGRIDALKAKVDYLRGLPLNPYAHPWTES